MRIARPIPREITTARLSSFSEFAAIMREVERDASAADVTMARNLRRSRHLSTRRAGS